jgi:hypothetical protein
MNEKIVIYATTSLFNELNRGIVIDGGVDIVIKSGFNNFDEANHYIVDNKLMNCRPGVYLGEL